MDQTPQQRADDIWLCGVYARVETITALMGTEYDAGHNEFEIVLNPFDADRLPFRSQCFANPVRVSDDVEPGHPGAYLRKTDQHIRFTEQQIGPGPAPHGSV